MNIVTARYLRFLASGLMTAGVLGCTPSVNRLGISQDVVDNLPAKVALSFLVTVHSSGSNPECLFQSHGVQVLSDGRLSSETKPYTSLVAALGPGRFEGGHLSLSEPGAGVYCLFGGSREASRHGMDNQRFLKKVFTALLAAGVQVPSRGGHSIKPREPASSRKPKRP
jgi:hypothetical protein